MAAEMGMVLGYLVSLNAEEEQRIEKDTCFRIENIGTLLISDFIAARILVCAEEV